MKYIKLYQVMKENVSELTYAQKCELIMMLSGTRVEDLHCPNCNTVQKIVEKDEPEEDMCSARIRHLDCK